MRGQPLRGWKILARLVEEFCILSLALVPIDVALGSLFFNFLNEIKALVLHGQPNEGKDTTGRLFHSSETRQGSLREGLRARCEGCVEFCCFVCRLMMDFSLRSRILVAHSLRFRQLPRM